MNVLSLFDGMSCGQIALDRTGIKVDNYYASEIDNHAITVTLANYPDTIQLGDINNWQNWDLPWHKIDLVLAGSPCQGFSFAGKQLAFEDPRSRLFFTFIDILEELKGWNPSIDFLLENVRMKKEYLDIITKYVGVDPVFINSALLSAQNRQRYYWTNLKITIPEDKGLLLSDILLEKGTPVIKNRGTYYSILSDKSMCLDANYFKGADNHGQRTLLYLSKEAENRGREKYKGKVWKSGNRMGNMQFPDKTSKKSKCLSATLIKGARETIHVEDKDGIRLLHPIECERLQTVPDNYTAAVSNTQRYKMLGNGWTVDVIAHILKGLL